MKNHNKTGQPSLPLRRALHIATGIALGTFGQTAAADIHVIGADFAALNPGVYAAPVGAANPSGNVTATDGDTWIALLASTVTIGQPRPVSSAIASGIGESATNFARVGAHIINALPGTAGIDRPKDAGEQFAELQAYLGGGAPAAGDILAITAFDNDIISQYENGTPDNVDKLFIDQRMAELQRIIEGAIGLGFQTVLVANMPRLDLLPGFTATMTSSYLTAMKADVDYHNQQTLNMLNSLEATHPNVTFLMTDIAKLLTDITANPGQYGFVDAASTAFDTTGSATGLDPNTVMWWDGLHPTRALHQLIADNTGVYQPQTVTGPSGSTGGTGSFGLAELLALLSALLPMTILSTSRRSLALKG